MDSSELQFRLRQMRESIGEHKLAIVGTIAGLVTIVALVVVFSAVFSGGGGDPQLDPARLSAARVQQMLESDERLHGLIVEVRNGNIIVSGEIDKNAQRALETQMNDVDLDGVELDLSAVEVR